MGYGANISLNATCWCDDRKISTTVKELASDSSILVRVTTTAHKHYGKELPSSVVFKGTRLILINALVLVLSYS